MAELLVINDKANKEQPQLILNKHCAICQFIEKCETKAVEHNNISILRGVSEKQIIKYNKKGILNLKQLSYSFKQRRRKKKISKFIEKIEVRALAVTTEKIYIEEIKDIERGPVELFIDFESIPRNDFHYLLGLLVKSDGNISYYHFWAESIDDEKLVWESFLSIILNYPTKAPIFHYGSYEKKVIEKIEKRYEFDLSEISKRLINVNSFIYGRIYFPVRSNALKDIGAYLGVEWNGETNSGLQSIITRWKWQESRDENYKKNLIAYNKKDCEALVVLLDAITNLKQSGKIREDVRYTYGKIQATDKSKIIHDALEEALRFGHFDYQKKRIKLDSVDRKPEMGKVKRKRAKSMFPTTVKKARVSPRIKCPKCDGSIVVRTPA